MDDSQGLVDIIIQIAKYIWFYGWKGKIALFIVLVVAIAGDIAVVLAIGYLAKAVYYLIN